METNSTQQFTSALAFEIELMNGNTSLVTTIFDSKEVYVEEILRNIKNGLANCKNVVAITASAGSIRGGKYKEHFKYNRIELKKAAV